MDVITVQVDYCSLRTLYLFGESVKYKNIARMHLILSWTIVRRGRWFSQHKVDYSNPLSEWYD